MNTAERNTSRPNVRASAPANERRAPNMQGAPRNGTRMPARRAPGGVARPARPTGGQSKSKTSYLMSSVARVVKSSMTSGKSDVKMATVRAEKCKPFPISVILMAVLVTGLFMFMIMSYVQINEYTIEVSALRSDISALASERKELSHRLDEKNDNLAIEQYASEKLNMVKIDQLTKKHITIDREDKIEVVESEPTEDDTVVTTMMSALFSNFNGLVECLG